MGDNNKVILAMIMMMKTSLNTKGQTVEWHTLFFCRRYGIIQTQFNKCLLMLLIYKCSTSYLLQN